MPKAPVSSAKAKKILHEGKANGQDLTPKQKRFFGRIAGGAKTINKAADGAGISSRTTIEEGIREAENTSFPIAAVASEPSVHYRADTSRRNILEGMADGGGAAGLVALANVLNGLDPIERQNRINALTLGLSSAEKQRDPYTINNSLDPNLLIKEVTRAYQAILGKVATPTSVPTQTPTQTPVPIPTTPTPQ